MATVTINTGPIEHVDPSQIRKVIAQLEQQRGEYAACAKVLAEVFAALYPDIGRVPPSKPRGFDEAYGDLTFVRGAR